LQDLVGKHRNSLYVLRGCGLLGKIPWLPQVVDGCRPAGIITSLAVGKDTNSNGGPVPVLRINISGERRAPDLVGKDYRSAHQLLRDCSLTAEFLPIAKLEGVILKTVPGPSEPLGYLEEMIVWTVADKKVPNVAGIPLAAARTQLESAGFQVTRLLKEKIDLAEWQRKGRRACAEVSTEWRNVVSTTPPGDSAVSISGDDTAKPAIVLRVQAAPGAVRFDEFCMAAENGTIIP
jgi:hypothetical protein